jgi:hypothetical protein
VTMQGLFPALLGQDFVNLAPAVRRVHCGEAVEMHGRADVSRGASWTARILCVLGRLARDQRDAPVRVEIETRGEAEVWTRHFGTSPVMRSVLSAHRGRLRERLGPAALEFSLSAERGAVIWRPVDARVFGVPLPARWLAGIEARAFETGGCYAFEVKVALPGVGTLIGYRGLLESPRSTGLAAR